MRYPVVTSLLIIICLLAGKPGLAQRAAIAPLVPRVVAVQGLAFRAALARKNNTLVTSVIIPTASSYWRPAPIPDPLFILNSVVIINGLLNDINPNDIKTLVVYKGVDAPPLWRGLASNGIVDITLKKKRSAKINSLTLAEIGQRLLLPGPVRYSVNGMTVAKADLRLAAAAIGDIKITRATAAVPTALVEIQTTPTGHKPLPPAPPGTIQIRGVASY